MVTSPQRVQDILNNQTGGKPKIGLDTNCLQYYLTNPPVQPWADCLDPIFQSAVSGAVDLFVSTVVVSEILAHAHFSARSKTGYDPELDMMAILTRHFQILDVTEDIAKAAGRIRGGYAPGDKMALKTPDVLIGATSLTNGHTLFITNDEQLSRVLPSDKCLYLRELGLEWLNGHFESNCLSSPVNVDHKKKGRGLPSGSKIVSPAINSIKPLPSADWQSVLVDGFPVAAALNESLLLFALSSKVSGKLEVIEIIIWGPNSTPDRPSKQILKHLRNFIQATKENLVHIFSFSSISEARARQNKPNFASKAEQQKESDAWKDSLSPIWEFRDALSFPQTSWFLCADEHANTINSSATVDFLKKAQNVLGWKVEKS